jgi:hypothetical protein
MLACGLLTMIYLQEALWFHIQLFGKLLQKGAIIGPTPPDVHDRFNRFFNCLEDITATHDNTTTTSTALGPEPRISLSFVVQKFTPCMNLFRRMRVIC